MKLYLNNVKNNIILAKSLVETGGNKIVDYWYLNGELDKRFITNLT